MGGARGKGLSNDGGGGERAPLQLGAALTLIFIDRPPNFQAVDLELASELFLAARRQQQQQQQQRRRKILRRRQPPPPSVYRAQC
jgi:hypothetical protein